MGEQKTEEKWKSDKLNYLYIIGNIGVFSGKVMQTYDERNGSKTYAP